MNERSDWRHSYPRSQTMLEHTQTYGMLLAQLRYSLAMEETTPGEVLHRVSFVSIYMLVG